MESLVNRQFVLQSSTDPNVFLGADNIDNCAVKPVITDGQMKKWSIKSEGMVLDEVWYSSHDGDQVVVRVGVHEGTKWQFAPVGGMWKIKSPDGDLYWTATGVGPKQKVVLEGPKEHLLPFQVWKLVYVDKD